MARRFSDILAILTSNWLKLLQEQIPQHPVLSLYIQLSKPSLKNGTNGSFFPVWSEYSVQPALVCCNGNKETIIQHAPHSQRTLSTCVACSHAVGTNFFEVSVCIAIRSERFYGVQLESLTHSVGSCQTEAMTRASSSDKIIRLKCKPGCKWNFLGWKTFAMDADNNLDDLHGVRQYLRAPSYSYYNDRLCSDTDTKEKERKTKRYIFSFFFFTIFIINCFGELCLLHESRHRDSSVSLHSTSLWTYAFFDNDFFPHADYCCRHGGDLVGAASQQENIL